jgi:hypothetical protein
MRVSQVKNKQLEIINHFSNQTLRMHKEAIDVLFKLREQFITFQSVTEGSTSAPNQCLLQF